MKVYFTKHAEERAQERSGHPVKRLIRRIDQAIRTDKVYRPSERVRTDESEMWVAVDGPKGKATAIIHIDEYDDACVITIRESESCQQGEGVLRNGNGGYKVFKDLLSGIVLS